MAPMFRGGLPSQLDHLLVTVPSLEGAMDSLERSLGARPSIGGRHAAWGTRNALLGLGGKRYLELVATDPDAPAEARERGERTFGFSAWSGPRVIGWCAATGDLEGRRRAAQAAGLEIGEPIEGGRERPDGSMVRWRITPPLFLGDGMIPFFIDWRESVHPAADAPSGCRLLRLEGEHPDPERIWRMLAAVDAQLSVSRGPRARLIATLEGPKGTVTISDGTLTAPPGTSAGKR